MAHNMSATNRRVRRAILEILYDSGPMTKEEMASALASRKGVAHVPSPHSLSALLCKSHSIIQLGKKKVENSLGVTTKHNVYDIDRDVILCKDELIHIREPSTMTPKEKVRATKCLSCGRTRIKPEGFDECLTCVRITE
tara:strand:- start:27 stop:443 length:417 start_codon:yes stop_codon:yes gene_type:complete